MLIKAPIILEDQEPIIMWARQLRAGHISTTTILEFLVSDKKTKSGIITENLETMRELYNSKNQNWRQQILFAIQVDAYKKENDIKDGNIVTDGNLVGFAYEFDYTKRQFALHTRKDAETEPINTFNIDNFRRV